MSDFAERRTTMVDTQIRPSDVTKFPIIDAMLSVPREQFVPVEKRETAYVGDHIDLGGGRSLLDPRVFAKMLEAANIQRSELVLDIGAGLGYSAAVFAHLTDAVIALEDDAGRVQEAERALAEAGVDNVAMLEGVLAEGAPKHGPYDVIFIEGAVQSVPEAISDQLSEGGRIVAIFADGALGAVRVGYRIDGEMTWRFAFNASAPLLDGFEAAKEFAL